LIPFHGTTFCKSITAIDLGLDEMPQEQQQDQKLLTLKEAREAAEKRAVYKSLSLTGNNISQAAKLLEVSRPTFFA